MFQTRVLFPGMCSDAVEVKFVVAEPMTASHEYYLLVVLVAALSFLRMGSCIRCSWVSPAERFLGLADSQVCAD